MPKRKSSTKTPEESRSSSDSDNEQPKSASGGAPHNSGGFHPPATPSSYGFSDYGADVPPPVRKLGPNTLPAVNPNDTPLPYSDSDQFAARTQREPQGYNYRRNGPGNVPASSTGSSHALSMPSYRGGNPHATGSFSTPAARFSMQPAATAPPRPPLREARPSGTAAAGDRSMPPPPVPLPHPRPRLPSISELGLARDSRPRQPPPLTPTSTSSHSEESSGHDTGPHNILEPRINVDSLGLYIDSIYTAHGRPRAPSSVTVFSPAHHSRTIHGATSSSSAQHVRAPFPWVPPPPPAAGLHPPGRHIPYQRDVPGPATGAPIVNNSGPLPYTYPAVRGPFPEPGVYNAPQPPPGQPVPGYGYGYGAGVHSASTPYPYPVGPPLNMPPPPASSSGTVFESQQRNAVPLCELWDAPVYRQAAEERAQDDVSPRWREALPSSSSKPPKKRRKEKP